jgi:hypothetical protein
MDDLLSRVGLALWGAHWQSPLARVLSVNDRTVRRWVSGESPVPSGIWGDLDGIIRERSEGLDTLSDEVWKRL